MKKLYVPFFVAFLVATVFSCTQDPQNLQPVFNGTNVVAGVWTMKVFHGDSVMAPMMGTLTMVATSDTSGTAEFNMTEDGVSNNVENSIYDLKSNIKTLYFSRTLGGNSGILVNGEKWKVDKLILHDDNKPDTFAMHSDITGESMLFSKP
jgi:hypothetical protein